MSGSMRYCWCWRRYGPILTLGVGGEVQSHHAVRRTSWVVAGHVQFRSRKRHHVLRYYTGMELSGIKNSFYRDDSDQIVQIRSRFDKIYQELRLYPFSYHIRRKLCVCFFFVKCECNMHTSAISHNQTNISEILISHRLQVTSVKEILVIIKCLELKEMLHTTGHPINYPTGHKIRKS